MNGSTAPSGGNVSTVHAALQVSGTGWILAVGDPADASRTGLHRLAPHDVDGLLGKLWRARDRAAAASGGDVRVMPVHGAGYGGFWLARRLEGEELEVVVRHPAGPGVVRRSRKGRTDRTGARRMVRAPPAWDGGDRDAMSPVRVPTVAEEEGRRLPRRRGRLVRERLRLAGAGAGLLRPRGIPPGDPARGGYRARPGGMRTACGTGLPPGLLAEIGGILDRLEPGVAGLKAVEADRAAALRSAREAAAREARDGPGEDGGAQAAVTEAAGAERADAPGTGRDGAADTPPGAAPAAVPAHARHAAVPGRLRGIGPNDALLPGAGLSCRDLRNRRQLAGMAGPGPVPWPGGAVDHARGPARPAARCCGNTWRGWPGAGSTTSRTARCRAGPCNTSAPATGVRAGAGSWRWRAGCWWRRCGSPRPGWRTGAPSCRRRRRRGRRTPNTRAARRGPRGTRAGRVTGMVRRIPRHRPSRWVPPPGTSHRPNGAPWSRGRRPPANRTGQEPGRAVGRSLESDVQPGESPAAPRRP